MKPDDVVVVAAVRTAVGVFGRSLRDYLAIDLAAMVIREAVKRARLEERLGEIGDVVFGQLYFRNKEEPNIGRLAAWKAGLPKEVPGMTIQRACASGLQAIILGAQEIIAGQCDIVIAGGAESMSNAPYELYTLRWGRRWKNEELFDAMYAPILDCPPTGIGMGMTAENLADMFNISREEMDQFAYTSHMWAARAFDEGRFEDEILPVPVRGQDGQETLFRRDESIRKDTSLEKLAQLPPVFKEGGKVTAGNSCPLNDAASVLVLMRRSKAEALGLAPMARVVSYAVVGVDPDIMGYGPIPATRKALAIAGLKITDIDLFEINEAFASVPLAYMKDLGVSRDVLNVNGGAIALGHPIGATGAKITTTLLYEMRRRGAKRGLTGICQGTGMGTAVIWESE